MIKRGNLYYPTKEFKPFVESLRKTDFNGDVIFFTNNLSKKTEKYFRSKGIILIPYSFEYPYLKDNKTILKKFKHFKHEKLNIFHMREFLPFIYLLGNKDKYDLVVIADTADVIFQKNPFEGADKNKVYFSLQDNKIKDSKKDSEWIEYLYGKEVLRKIWDKNVCCTGTLIGGIKPMLNFLDLFVNEFKGNTIEQGNINYLIHNNKIKNAVLFKNSDGVMLTCSGANRKDFIVDKNKKIRSKSGKMYSMIHQYDTFLYWSFLQRGICRRSLRETIKRLPFIGNLLVRLKAIFVKSYVHLDKEGLSNTSPPTSQEK